MMALADTFRLVEDQVLTPEQATEIEARSRATMTALAVNAVLCFGILAATGGLIFWLAAPLPVAVFGALALIVGGAILMRGDDALRIFGNAAALIGAGMLIGGGAFELIERELRATGPVMLLCGMVIAALSGWLFLRARAGAGFAFGAVFLMGLALHITGLGWVLSEQEIAGLGRALGFLYAATLIAGAGTLIDVRFITALAIVPFAQMLDTGTQYFYAAYVFFSPESTLTILQMGLLIALCLWLGRGSPDRLSRHSRVTAVLGFVVLNLAALVGSLWGDVVGERIWGPRAWMSRDIPWEERRRAYDAFDAFEQSALVISEHAYSIGWGVLLIALIFYFARSHQRGLFNTALTFGLIHAYTQLFESFGDQPLAYVIGGLAAVPLAWGLWWLNRRMA